MSGWLPPGVTDADIDKAAPGYDEEPEQLDPETADIVEDLYEIEEYFAQRADADHIEGRYRPNEEMRLIRGLKRAIAKLEGKP